MLSLKKWLLVLSLLCSIGVGQSSHAGSICAGECLPIMGPGEPIQIITPTPGQVNPWPFIISMMPYQDAQGWHYMTAFSGKGVAEFHVPYFDDLETMVIPAGLSLDIVAQGFDALPMALFSVKQGGVDADLGFNFEWISATAPVMAPYSFIMRNGKVFSDTLPVPGSAAMLAQGYPLYIPSVPEPVSAIMLTLGLMLLWGRQRLRPES